MEQIRDFMVRMLQQLGGDHSAGGLGPRIIVLIIIVLVLGILVLGLLRLLFRQGSRNNGGRGGFQPSERLGSMMGRLEKLEMTVNDFKTETMRWQEFCNMELKYLRAAIDDVKDLLREEEGEGSVGGGGTPRGHGGGAPGGRPRGGGSGFSRAIEREAAPQAAKAAPQLESGTVRLAQGLQKTRESFFSKIRGVFGKRGRIDQQQIEELEELLIGSDLGVRTVQELIQAVRDEISAGGSLDQEALLGMLKEKILEIVRDDKRKNPAIVPPAGVSPYIVMLVGVNGSGKTTTTAKLAQLWKDQGLRVLLVAADTFRAGAVDQLSTWAVRLDVPFLRGADGAKPGAVVFDAMQRSQKEQYDVVVIDTAGRLHTKSNLMQELEGIRNIIARHYERGPHETILVVDGSTGQNALSQAKEFNAAVPLTGVIVTKLDGTPKGGIVVAIKGEVGVPVRYIGVGERPEDLRVFSAEQFVDALLASQAQLGGAGTNGNGIYKDPNRPTAGY